MKTFKVIVEHDTAGKWTLTAPALPGYVACGNSEEKVLALAREGIPFHLDSLREEGMPMPEGAVEAKVVELEMAA